MYYIYIFIYIYIYIYIELINNFIKDKQIYIIKCIFILF